MTTADGVHSTQGETAPEIPPQLIEQELRRQEAIETLSRLRNEAFAEVDRLIAFLDASDEYVQTELEPSLGFNQYGSDDREQEDEHNEPALGWTDTEAKRGHYSISECEVDRSDDEPSLGSTEGIAMNEGRSQEYWAQGRTDDVEDEHDGREPDGESDDCDYEIEPDLVA